VLTHKQTCDALAPYRANGRKVLDAAQDGGIDFTEAKQSLDEFLAQYLKPEAATAQPGE
jgi:hypothetical protein